MANIFEDFLGKRKTKEEEPITKEPTFEDLCESLSEDLGKELRDLVKDVSGEEGPSTDYFEGNYEDLTPEQRRYNKLLSQAKHAHSESGERM